MDEARIREIVREGNAWSTIILTNGLIALIDDADVPLVAALRWSATKSGATRKRWYATATFNNRTVYLHRLLLRPSASEQVDHINGDGLDNRRCNLRIATRSQNCANSTNRPTQSGFRGVRRQTGSATFQASVKCNNRWHRQYGFRSAIDAAIARDEMAAALHGAFARLNFPAANHGRAASPS